MLAAAGDKMATNRSSVDAGDGLRGDGWGDCPGRAGPLHLLKPVWHTHHTHTHHSNMKHTTFPLLTAPWVKMTFWLIPPSCWVADWTSSWSWSSAAASAGSERSTAGGCKSGKTHAENQGRHDFTVKPRTSFTSYCSWATKQKKKNKRERRSKSSVSFLWVSFRLFECSRTLFAPAVWHNVNPRLNHRVHFASLRTSQRLLHYLQSSALVLELWGLQGGEQHASTSACFGAKMLGM